MHVEWQVLKASARGQVGQTIASELDDAADTDGLGELHSLRESVSASRRRVRFLPGSIEAWTDRARKAAVLGHPNVTPVVGIGASGGRVFLVEEQPDGVPLRVWIAQHRASGGATLAEVAKLIAPVVGALGHAHGAGVVHGGLSAGCVSVARDGLGDFEVRVGGFGVVAGLRALRTSVAVEVWDTLAAELTEESIEPTVASDLYAVGVLLLEVLTGSVHVAGTRHPWREFGRDPVELRRVLGLQRDDVPDGLWELIAGLLAHAASSRKPATARDLARALQKLSWEPKPTVHAPSPEERARVSIADLPPAPPLRPMGIVSTSRRVAPSDPGPTAPTSMPAPPVRDPMPVPSSRLSEASATAASDTLFDEDAPEMEPAQPVRALAPYSADLGLMNPAESDWASGVPPVPTTKFTGDGTATLLGTAEPDASPQSTRRALSPGAGAATIQYGDERAPLDASALDSSGPLLATRQILVPRRAAPSGADVATIGFAPDALEVAALRLPTIHPHIAPAAPVRADDTAAATLELLPTPAALAVPPSASRASMAPGESPSRGGVSGPTVVAIALGLMVLFGALGWYMGTSGTGH